MTRVFLLVLALAVPTALVCADEPPKAPKNRNVRYGMPGEAKDDPASKEAHLIDRPQYVLSVAEWR